MQIFIHNFIYTEYDKIRQLSANSCRILYPSSLSGSGLSIHLTSTTGTLAGPNASGHPDCLDSCKTLL